MFGWGVFQKAKYLELLKTIQVGKILEKGNFRDSFKFNFATKFVEFGAN